MEKQRKDLSFTLFSAVGKPEERKTIFCKISVDTYFMLKLRGIRGTRISWMCDEIIAQGKDVSESSIQEYLEQKFGKK